MTEKKHKDLYDALVEEAKVFWRECPYDFCIQHEELDSGVIVFGSVNRVVWSIRRGFTLDRSYCTEKFIKHFEVVKRAQ